MQEVPTIAQPNSTVALTRFHPPESIELLKRRSELADLQRVLLAREEMLGDLRAQIVSFEGRYLRQVGLLYRRLDEWEQKIADLHGRTRVVEEEAALEEFEEATPRQQAVLKELFRELVKLLHPDLAADAADEQRRTRLMSLANEAYAREDSASIRRMLSGYDPLARLTSTRGVHDEVVRLMRMAFQVTQDIEAVNLQIEELQRSDSAQLQERTLEAARQGRDLLAEMAARVNGSIGLAMRRYELDLSRIQRPSKGMQVESLLSAEIQQA